MMTNSTLATDRSGNVVPVTPVPELVQKVVIVNGNAAILDMVETALEAGHYDVVFVESSRHAYSQIKRVQPNLVILCLQVDDMEGFHVLSMLKLDDDTRAIPVLTYTTQQEPASEDESDDSSDPETIFAGAKTAGLMN
ncbi:MAG: response regulator [bacterium]